MKLQLNFLKRQKNSLRVYMPDKIFSSIKKEFLQHFDFTKTDLGENKFFRLADKLPPENNVYSNQKYDIGRIKQHFNIPLIKKAEFKKQRPGKKNLSIQVIILNH